MNSTPLLRNCNMGVTKLKVNFLVLVRFFLYCRCKFQVASKLCPRVFLNHQLRPLYTVRYHEEFSRKILPSHLLHIVLSRRSKFQFIRAALLQTTTHVQWFVSFSALCPGNIFSDRRGALPSLCSRNVSVRKEANVLSTL